MPGTLEQVIGDQLPRIFQERLEMELRPEKLHAGQSPPEGEPGYDFRYRLDLGDEVRTVYVEVKADDPRRMVWQLKAWQEQLRKLDPDALPLLAAPSLGERAREELREQGIHHVDLEGNVYIWEPRLRIRIEGGRSQPRAKAARKHGRRLNPFSKRASFVLRALLQAPRRTCGIRELSAETGLSVGYTSDVVSELVERGYVEESGRGYSLKDPVRALFDWTVVYRWDRNPIHSFVVPYELDELRDMLVERFTGERLRFALTLLAGMDLVASHVQHNQMHAYLGTENLARSLAIVAEDLYGQPVESGGNLHILEPYYAQSAFYGIQHMRDLPVVSNVQLFLDLVHYPLRGAEAATMLVRTALRSQLQLDGEQVQALVTLIGGD